MEDLQQGEQGEQGEQGIQGIQGVQGIPGRPGAPQTSSVKKMLEMDIGLKQELTQMFKAFSRNQFITIVLTSICTMAIIIVFIFYFTRPTKVDILVFKQIQKERGLIKAEREYVRQQRDSLKADKTALYNLQKKK